MSTARPNLLLPSQARWPLAEPVIELIGVHKSFGEQAVLKGVDLVVPTGKTTVIAGESGGGKSVLLRMMNGLTRPDQGQVKLFGQDLATLSERQRTELRKRCTMVFQSYALIDSLTVAENIGFPLRENTRMPATEIRRRVAEILELLELSDAIDQLPAGLSGGMKKRVAFARAVITQPEVVLFDEPTTGLDPVMIEFVDGLIRRTQQTFGLTSVIISHDMASNRRLADQMAVLSEGRIVACGPFDAVRESPLPEVQAFLGGAVVERLGPAAASAPTIEAVAAPAVELAAQVEGLYKSFGDHLVLKGVDLSIPKGKITVVIGGSGSGKSVLIKHLIGLLKPDQGTVTVFGQRLGDLSTRELSVVQGRIGMLFQSAALFDSLTVRENISFPLLEGRHKRPRREVKDRVNALAERVKVHELLDRYPAAISNGERKRVGLARALITEPAMMIYDEPTTGQDPVLMRRVDDMIVETQASFDITSVVISHDMVSTFRIADQIALIHKGEVAAAGSPDQLKASQDERVRRFIFAGA